MKIRDTLIKGIYAGILIGLGGSCYIIIENKYVGAFLFSLGLVCICARGDFLYTGRVCYLPQNFNIKYIVNLIIGFIGNFIGTFVIARLLAVFNNQAILKSRDIVSAKLDVSMLDILIKGILCGILIYLAVDLYKKKNTFIPILLCIPAFILCGFEHSIADMFYISLSGIINYKSLFFIIIVAVGNLIGGVCLNIGSKDD